jgi:hypothetical protein
MAKKKETYWNYRIYAKECVSNSGVNYTEYGITEVYYKGDKIEGYIADFMTPWGESEEDLKLNFDMMKKAFEYPVLTIDDLEPKKKSKKIKKKKAGKKNAKSKS